MKNLLSLRKDQALSISIVVAYLITFFPTIRWMIARFREPDSYYSHGFLIPLVSAYFIWEKRDVLCRVGDTASRYALALGWAAIAVHLSVGIFLGVNFVSGIMMVAVLIGIIWYIFGATALKSLLFPLLFLLCMVPLPKVLLIAITFKLKMIAAHCAVMAVQFMHVPVQRAGSILYLPQGVLTVENECSGINSLISLLTLSVIFAYIMNAKWYGRAAMVVLSVPIAIIANTIRIIVLILAAYIYGVQTASRDVIHYGAGFALWIAAFSCYIMIWRAMESERSR